MGTSSTSLLPSAAVQIVLWVLSASIASIHLRKASVGQPNGAKQALSWVHCVSLAMTCPRLPGSILQTKNTGCLLGCSEGFDCLRHYNECPTLFRSLLAIWSGTTECISPTVVLSHLLFKTATQSDRLCILVSGLVDNFVTAFNLRRTRQAHRLRFHELMYGRIKMMTALCPEWAHTHQTMRLGFSPLQLRPRKKKPMLPNGRAVTKMTGMDSPGWRFFSPMELLHAPSGRSDLAGWGIAAGSLDNFVRIHCGRVVCVILAILLVFGPHRAVTTPRNSLVLLKLSDA